MRNNQQGFTLIELVVVIMILGILAATALPKFINLSGSAQTAATQGVATGMGSAMAVNYAARKASSGAKGVAVTDCNTGSLLAGGLPSNYTITGSTIAAESSGQATLNGPGNTSSAFTCLGVL